jgi:hypothetical protein
VINTERLQEVDLIILKNDSNHSSHHQTDDVKPVEHQPTGGQHADTQAAQDDEPSASKYLRWYAGNAKKGWEPVSMEDLKSRGFI